MVSPDDFGTVLDLSADLGIQPRNDETSHSDISAGVRAALVSKGDDTLIKFDESGVYEASSDITPPSDVSKWGLYAPPDIDASIKTPHAVPKASPKTGLFGGYVIERGTETAASTAVDITARSTGTRMDPAKDAGRVTLAPIYVADDGGYPSARLAADRKAVIDSKRLQVSGSASNTPASGVVITPEHNGHVRLADAEAIGYPIGIDGRDAPGTIHVTGGTFMDNMHGIRLSGHETIVNNARIHATRPNSAGIVWDAGATLNSGGEIRECDITVNGGRTAIAAADIAGRCTIAECDIEYNTLPESGRETGAVIDAPSPSPTNQTGTGGELAGPMGWEIRGTSIYGEGNPSGVIWITDRPDSRTHNMTISMNNTDGVIYDGTTDGRLENSIINVRGTTARGEMFVSDIDEVATPGGLA